MLQFFKFYHLENQYFTTWEIIKFREFQGIKFSVFDTSVNKNLYEFRVVS